MFFFFISASQIYASLSKKYKSCPPWSLLKFHTYKLNLIFSYKSIYVTFSLRQARRTLKDKGKFFFFSTSLGALLSASRASWGSERVEGQRGNTTLPRMEILLWSAFMLGSIWRYCFIGRKGGIKKKKKFEKLWSNLQKNKQKALRTHLPKVTQLINTKAVD